MARGGARPGAGRKRGTISQKTRERREVAKRLKFEGVMPLEVILTTMRDVWADANRGPAPNLAKRMQAVMLAEKAAPYLHPRLANVAPDSGEEDDPTPVKVEVTVRDGRRQSD